MKIRSRISSGILIAAVAAATLAGCGRGQGTGSQQGSVTASAASADAEQAKKSALLSDISGVWNPDDNSGLWMLYYADNRFESVLGDNFMPVTVGDVDATNETVNLKFGGQDGQSHIITIRRVWDSAHTTFHLSATLWDGTQASLSFVRKVSSDDLNHIAQLEAASQHQAGQSSLASAVSATQAQPSPQSPPPVVAAPASDATNSAQSTSLTASPAASSVPSQAASPAPAPSAPGTTYQTSFDCGTAGSLPQYLICHDQTLAAFDLSLAKTLEQARASARDQQAFGDRVRKQWNYRESHCKDVSCLTAWYQYESTVLTKIAQTGDANAQ
ncbi:lysozyme inhibitor LprI family protein [Paraburkholderia heleia]|uniref:hypothetical protein n=1 Tax=Paraburkholderia heleia TaxID=634127 RepID=UPI002AB6C723|nr:hypothetical protein [Paraburkholderia heleia]